MGRNKLAQQEEKNRGGALGAAHPWVSAQLEGKQAGPERGQAEAGAARWSGLGRWAWEAKAAHASEGGGPGERGRRPPRAWRTNRNRGGGAQGQRRRKHRLLQADTMGSYGNGRIKRRGCRI